MVAEPEFVAGCRMPSDMTITQNDKYVYAEARMGCDALLARLRAYALKHHPESALAAEARAAARPAFGLAAPAPSPMETNP